MATKLHVCQSTSCTSFASPKLVCDIEELVQGNIEVVWSSCLEHCGKGPNVEVFFPGKKASKVIEHIDSFKKVEQLLVKEAGLKLDKQRKQVAELKYDARRGKTSDERAAKLEKAFKAAGGEADVAKKDPRTACELLTLRAREAISTGKGVVGGATDSQGEMSLEDAQLAVKLVPKFGRAHVALAYSLERLGRFQEAEKALIQAEEAADGTPYRHDAKDAAALTKRLQPKLKALKDDENAAEKATRDAEAAKAAETAAAEKKKVAEAAAAAKKKAAAAKARAKKKHEEEAKKKAEEEAKKKADEAAQHKAAEEANTVGNGAENPEADKAGVSGADAKDNEVADSCSMPRTGGIKCPALEERIVSL